MKETLLSPEMYTDMGSFWELTRQTYFTIGFMLFPVCLTCILIFSVTSVNYGIKHYIEKKKWDSYVYEEYFLWSIGYLITSIVALLIILTVLPMLV